MVVFQFVAFLFIKEVWLPMEGEIQAMIEKLRSYLR